MRNRFKAFNPDAFPAGETQIWYWKEEFGFHALMGATWLTARGRMPAVAAISLTHVKLGTLAETDLERIFRGMQAESWSPAGEAWDIIAASGAGHTSMSVGDIVRLPNGSWHMVDIIGFVRID